MATGLPPIPAQITHWDALRKLLIAALFCTLVNFSPTAHGTDQLPWQTSTADSEDAPLRSCAAPSPESLWAVGDRGLVMNSSDGGRTWKQVAVPTNVDLYQVAFADAKHGYIVGGFIWPVTGRSDGCLLKTKDGGATWTSSPLMSLGRLTGIHVFGKDHILVWGDWSGEQRGALLESVDGGLTFQRKETPCAQVATSAWLNPAFGVVVDRLSRVFVTQNGQDFKQVELPANPISPIRNASTDGSTVWLSGEGAQLYKSNDLGTWEKVNLNNLANIGVNLSLSAVRQSKDGRIWMTTNLPGVVLNSTDGRTFQIDETQCSVMLYDCCSVAEGRLIAVGAMNNIVETQNAGDTWAVKNQRGNKLGMLIIAPRIQDVALDAMVQCAFAENQHAGVLVLHSQDAISKADVWPDAEQRFRQIASVTASSWSSMMTRFPVGSLTSSATRKIDVSGYHSQGQESSLIEREIVFAIRSLKPDIVVVSSSELSSQLASHGTAAAYRAIQLAADPKYSLWPANSFVELPSWRVQKTMSRMPRSSNNAISDWTIGANGLLSNNQTVGDRVRVAAGLLQSPYDTANFVVSETTSSSKPNVYGAILWNRMNLYGNYQNRSASHRNKSQVTKCFAGILQSEGTKRQISDIKVRNPQVLNATLHLDDRLNTLLAMDLNDEVGQKKWLQDLQLFVATLASEDRARFLLELGLVYQNRGDIPHWKICHEYVLSEPVPSVWKEIALHVASQFATSREFHHAFNPRSNSQNSSAINVAAVQPAAFRSPFEASQSAVQSAEIKQQIDQQRLVAGKDTGGNVFSASYVEKTMDFQPQKPSLEQPDARVSIATAYTAATGQSRPMDRLEELMLKTLGPRQYDPRVLLGNSSAQIQRGSADEKTIASLRSLMNCTAMLGWPGLVSSELNAQKTKGTFAGVTSNYADEPPQLNGVLDEPFWQAASSVQLSSPWKEDIGTNAVLKIANDSRYLYFGIVCPKAITDLNLAQATKSANSQPLRDASMDQADHFTIRLDVDRDYQTYFQFSVSEDKNRSDSVNQFSGWDPKWHIAQISSAESWIAEIAIPLDETLGLDPSQATIGINARRQLPGIGVQNLGGVPIDGWIPQTFQVVRLTAPVQP